VEKKPSDSVLAVVVAARTLYPKDHPDTNLENLVIYTTTQTHSVGSKAALVLGLQLRSIEVKAEDEFSFREDALRNALEDDAKIGQKPFILSKAFNDPLGAK
jgi:aromatic-L-amino-acid decarboxylase